MTALNNARTALDQFDSLGLRPEYAVEHAVADALRILLDGHDGIDSDEPKVTGPQVGEAWVKLVRHHPSVTVEQVREALEAALNLKVS